MVLLCSLLFWAVTWLFPTPAIASKKVPRVDARPVLLFDNLGTHHHQITTNSEQAQKYFDQGLRLIYAFNHEEAIRAFEEAVRLDPTAAMAYWGIALALGPNINAPSDQTSERRAWDAIQQAEKHRAHVSAAERAYIDAISTRYSLKIRKRVVLDQTYANAMRSLWKHFPDDLDAGTLFAEALMDLRPWDLWTADGQPKPGTKEIVTTLETILTRAPDHPGACHYYIHAVEASPTPERAVACAERLPRLMPGAGHLVHMPAHIYMRLGRYHEAAEHNEHAAHIDENYFGGRKTESEYAGGYYTHNLHFLWAALAMEGRRADAMKVADQLTHLISEQDVRKDKAKEFYLPTRLWTMIRFGQWDALLREPMPPQALRLQHGVWRLGRGLALVRSGRLPGAEGEHATLMGLTKRLGRDRTPEEKTQRTMLKIAERLLAGEIAGRRKQYSEAIQCFVDATKLEDALPYMEPPFWPIPVRQYHGALLLMAGKPDIAETVYRTDLTRNPRNGWAYYGLLQSLRAQRKQRDLGTVEPQFKAAWTHADVTLTASRL